MIVMSLFTEKMVVSHYICIFVHVFLCYEVLSPPYPEPVLTPSIVMDSLPDLTDMCLHIYITDVICSEKQERCWKWISPQKTRIITVNRSYYSLCLRTSTLRALVWNRGGHIISHCFPFFPSSFSSVSLLSSPPFNLLFSPRPFSSLSHSNQLFFFFYRP